MLLIEPCCTPKHLLALRGKLGDDGTAFFHGYGDLSLAELLPHMLSRYVGVEMMLVAPSLPTAASGVLYRMMQKQRLTAAGKGRLDVISRLTLITNIKKTTSQEVSSWLQDNTFSGRLEVRDVQQNDTAVILPDIAFFGNINMSYGGHFTAVATRNQRLMAELRRNYDALR